MLLRSILPPGRRTLVMIGEIRDLGDREYRDQAPPSTGHLYFRPLHTQTTAPQRRRAPLVDIGGAAFPCVVRPFAPQIVAQRLVPHDSCPHCSEPYEMSEGENGGAGKSIPTQLFGIHRHEGKGMRPSARNPRATAGAPGFSRIFLIDDEVAAHGENQKALDHRAFGNAAREIGRLRTIAVKTGNPQSAFQA